MADEWSKHHFSRILIKNLISSLIQTFHMLDNILDNSWWLTHMKASILTLLIIVNMFTVEVWSSSGHWILEATILCNCFNLYVWIPLNHPHLCVLRSLDLTPFEQDWAILTGQNKTICNTKCMVFETDNIEGNWVKSK